MESLDEVNWNAVAVALGVIAVVGVIWWNPMKNYIGEMKMKRQRRENIHNYLVGKLVELVEEDIAHGHLTRLEARSEIYEPFKRVFYTQKDLFPIEERLKTNIKKRIDQEVHEPVVLPDKKRKNLLGR